MFEKQLIHRQEEVERSKKVSNKIRTWTLKQEGVLDLTISKKAQLSEHLKTLFENLLDEMKKHESTYDLK